MDEGDELRKTIVEGFTETMQKIHQQLEQEKSETNRVENAIE